MKTILVMVLIVLTLITQVSASTIQRTDFSTNPEFIRLEVKDALRFNMFDGEHEIMLRSIKPETQSAKLTVFIEGAPTPVYAPLEVNTNVMLDLNKDRNDDLKIEIVLVQSDNAVIKITDLTQEQVTDQIETTENQESGNNTKVGMIIVAVIIVLGLMVFLIFRKKN